MKQSLLFVPFLLALAALACTGTLTGITGEPVYICPTPVVLTPTPLPTFVPIPGYPTFVPFPTALPPPTVTPYAIRPPAAFYVVLGVGLICLIFMVIVLFSGVKAVWNSFNRLFNAFGQATGGAVISPGAAAVVGVAGAVGAAGLASAVSGSVVGVGSSAMAGATALRSGATPAQAAGLTFGGVEPLADAARAITRLPTLRSTAPGDAAEQFTEGATTRRIARDMPIVGRAAAPLIGASLLTDYNPEKAKYDDKGRLVSRPMLVPAVGERLQDMIYPDGNRPRQADAPSRMPRSGESWLEDEDGELSPTTTAMATTRRCAPMPR
jgi:hypothetical protein